MALAANDLLDNLAEQPAISAITADADGQQATPAFSRLSPSVLIDKPVNDDEQKVVPVLTQLEIPAQPPIIAPPALTAPQPTPSASDETTETVVAPVPMPVIVDAGHHHRHHVNLRRHRAYAALKRVQNDYAVRAPAPSGRIPPPIGSVFGQMLLAARATLAGLTKNRSVSVELHPDFAGKAKQVADIMRAKGYRFVISSGVRSAAEQRYLRHRARVAARRSMHEFGLAVDFGYRGGGRGRGHFYRDLARTARGLGLESGLGYNDPYHVSIHRADFFAGLASGHYQRISPVPGWRSAAADATAPRRPQRQQLTQNLRRPLRHHAMAYAAG